MANRAMFSGAQALLTLMLVASATALEAGVAAAQYPLSDVEVRMVRTPGDGCGGPCSRYEVRILGDGTVEYDGTVFVAGDGQLSGFHTRSIPADDVISLVNEFLRARFFEAFDTYGGGHSRLVREGDKVILYGFGGGFGAPKVELTLRIGDRNKTITFEGYSPPEFSNLPELVDRIGGPRVW